MQEAEQLRCHAQHFRELALLAEYPLTISQLLDEADAFDSVAREMERDEATRH